MKSGLEMVQALQQFQWFLACQRNRDSCEQTQFKVGNNMNASNAHELDS